MNHALSIVFLGAAWVGAGVIVVWGMYYQAQAINNLKPESRWAGKFILGRGYIPRGEFTERGLWYRRRYFIVMFIFAAWGFLIMAPAFWLAAS
jgi:hypothetical protein